MNELLAAQHSSQSIRQDILELQLDPMAAPLVFAIGSMVGAVFWPFALPVIFLGCLGSGIYGITEYLLHKDDYPERDMGTFGVILQINSANLRGRDIQKLHGLQVDFIDADTALFSTGDFSVEGNVTMHAQSEQNKGLVTGELSFQVPGLDAPADGTFMLVNKTAADEKTMGDFDKIHAFLQNPPSGPIDPADVFASLAQAL